MRRPLAFLFSTSITLLALTAVLTVPPLPTAAAAATALPTTRSVHITAADGIALSAFVIQPPGTGPFPLLVMPSSWAVGRAEYVGAASRLAYTSGYVVVSYTARGFLGSGGTIQVAGPPDVADVRSVIDWALVHAEADPHRIGVAGVSYGAGIGLLAAAADPRIKAVGALSGWSDLAASLCPGGTISEQAAAALLVLAAITGRAGAPLQQAQRAYLQNRPDLLVDLSPPRSVANMVTALNQNGTALFLANAYEDSIFGPQQLVDLTARLRAPHRLLLGPGDHATREVFGLAGFPDHVWDEMSRWMDRWVRGVDNGADHAPALELSPALGGPPVGFTGWEQATARTDRWQLGPPRLLSGTGDLHRVSNLNTSGSPSWSRTIAAGVPTLAESGTALLTGALQGFFQIAPSTWLPLVLRSAAGVWVGPVSAGATTVRGTPRLHLTLSPSAGSVTVFGYLYDVDAGGLARLITHEPRTLNVPPGAATSVDLRLQTIDWRVPAGHRLAVVLDTVDPRYRSVSRIGTSLAISSPATNPSYLDLPMG